MMGEFLRITSIEKAGHGKVQVFLNDEPAFLISAGMASDLDLTVGMDITDEQKERILSTVVLREAVHRCIDLLKTRDRTVFQLIRSMANDGYTDIIAREAVNRLKEKGYLDDSVYAENYILSHAEDQSVSKIISVLKSRGVSSEDIRTGFERNDPVDQKSQIIRLLEKKRDILQSGDSHKIELLLASFVRKGYSYHDVKEAVDSFLI